MHPDFSLQGSVWINLDFRLGDMTFVNNDNSSELNVTPGFHVESGSFITRELDIISFQ